MAADFGQPMLPLPYVVADRRVETHDAVTLALEPVGEPLPPFQPGQFSMIYAHGIGEVPISVSGIPDRADGSLLHTVRGVGAVSLALRDASPGRRIGLRGPFGVGWDLHGAPDDDVVVVAGGIGLAPLRPVVLAVLDGPSRPRRVTLVAGARTPGDLLFQEEAAYWARRGAQVELTVDRPAPGWTGQVGFVTEPLSRLDLDPTRTTAFLCGPEAMMRFSATVLIRKGLRPEQVQVSLERNMKCGVGLCGHCQLGPLLLCRDGPVVDYRLAEPLLITREL